MGLDSAVYPTVFYESWNAGVIPPDVFGIAINWFVNRTPLLDFGYEPLKRLVDNALNESQRK